jgi:predicted enzyme related to lactoylglutathione lyase
MLWVSGKTQTGGLMAQPQSARQAGAPPSWLVYIGTPDVDSTAADAQRLGGQVLKSPADIPGIGRFAVISDPQGAAFAIFTPGSSAPPGEAPATDFSWHELATSDQQGALAFYSELFGWSRGPAHDMGQMGTYQLIEQGGVQIGGVYKLMDTSKAPHWLTYIQVASVDRAAAAARAAGGQVTQGPMEVPGGSRIAQILDPQGGAFAVHEPAKQDAASSSQARGKAEPAAKPSPAAKPAKTRSPARKSAARKAPASKTPTRRAAAKVKKRPAASKRVARKSSNARKAAAKRSTGRKSAARKAAKKPAKSRRTARRRR